MTMRPKVSIIVPIYNVEVFFEECVDSLIHQTLKEIEIILVDDESPDHCPALCDEYARKDKRIRVIHKKNGGLGFARNSGMEIATGDFIAFVDADDFVDIHMFEKLYRLAVEYNADEVKCGSKRYYGDGHTISRSDVGQITIFNDIKKVRDFALDMIGPLPENKRDMKYMISAWGAIHRRSVILNHQVWFLSERDILSEDLVWDAALMPLMSSVVITPECYYYYRVNKTSLTHSWSLEKYRRQYAMFKVVEDNLKINFSREEYRIHLLRSKFLYLRNSLGAFSRLHQLNNLKKVLKDPFWDDLLNDYPWQKLELKKRLYFMAVKTKNVLLVSFIQKLF
ncbi:MAG: glycosyltransferase [Bacteroidaceae bacterium]